MAIVRSPITLYQDVKNFMMNDKTMGTHWEVPGPDGEFGFGGEVGISTNKLPPRGPVGLNQLVSYKYEIIGSGQIRK